MSVAEEVGAREGEENTHPRRRTVDAEALVFAIACGQLVFALDEKRNECAGEMRLLLIIEIVVSCLMSGECRRKRRVDIERRAQYIVEGLPSFNLRCFRLFFFYKKPTENVVRALAL